jgi:hypothetical protein
MACSPQHISSKQPFLTEVNFLPCFSGARIAIAVFGARI